ncbi:hypothetical protein [Micromonospora sp. NPDC005710]|uniref:hypothetical protein n=1 Tax=Micromonospora sp. NPDC005710 TaxID=3157051 RepID=UPI0033CD38CC
MVLAAGCDGRKPDVAADVRNSATADRGELGLLLGAGDLGADWQVDDARAGVPPWPWEQNSCPDYRRGDYPATAHRRHAVERYYRLPDGSSPAHHVVETFEPGWAERNIDDVRRVLLRCASYPVLGSQVSFDVVDPYYLEGAGMLIRGRIARAGVPNTVTYVVIVKRGETVSTVRLPDPGSRTVVNSIAARVVARLG